MEYPDTERERVERFVLHASERAIQPDSLSIVNYYSWFLSFIAVVYGVLLGGVYLAIALFLVVLSVVYVPISEVLKRRLRQSLTAGFICNSLVSVFTLVFFAALGLLFFIMQSPSLVQWFLLVITYALLLLVYYFLIMRSIRKDMYEKAKARPNNAAAAAAIGASIGMITVQAFFSDIDVDLVLGIVSSTWFLLSLVFSLGTVNILKYYYCKKYGFEEVYPLPKLKKYLKKKMSRVKKALLILLGAVLLFFVVALTIGWFVWYGYI
jgi:hypothetical protein